MSNAISMMYAAKRLYESDDFQEVFRVLEEEQARIFLNASSSDDEVQRARRIVVALREMLGTIDAIIADGRIEQEKQDRE